FTHFAAVSRSRISPSITTRFDSGDNDPLALSDVATTLYPHFRKPSTSPAPIPCCAPVTIAVFFASICPPQVNLTTRLRLGPAPSRKTIGPRYRRCPPIQFRLLLFWPAVLNATNRRPIPKY